MDTQGECTEAGDRKCFKLIGNNSELVVMVAVVVMVMVVTTDVKAGVGDAGVGGDPAAAAAHKEAVALLRVMEWGWC